jgi:MFS family permease
VTTREDPPPAPARPILFLTQLRSFERPFWAGNTMELLERLAYYGVRVVIPVYIASSEDPAGLHFTNADKGEILSAWALVQTLVPMFSGGYADRYGRKPTIALSIAIKIAGYLMMATQRSFGGFLAGCLTLALGTAIFKPGVHGTVARGTTRANSSLGWGIFYEVVNLGSVFGPPLAGALHRLAWKWVFVSCAAIVSLNFLMLLTYEDDPGTGTGDPVRVFVHSMRTFFRPRLVTFVLIMSGFWLMFMQLYDSLPNFIEEWVDSADVVRALGLQEGQLAQMTSRGLQVPQEWMINLDAAAIVLFVVPMSILTARIRRLSAIFVGTFIAAGGMLLGGSTMSGALCVAGILLFAIGEMVGTPKMYEYLGVIAPRGEEALYMGFTNVPVAVGWTLGSYFAGVLYDQKADKANLAVRYLREHAGMAAEAAAAIPRTEAMKQLEAATHTDARGATALLWSTYHPYVFWYAFVAIGVVSAVGMVLYARAARAWTTENA